MSWSMSSPHSFDGSIVFDKEKYCASTTLNGSNGHFLFQRIKRSQRKYPDVFEQYPPLRVLEQWQNHWEKCISAHGQFVEGD
ncbi:hypothetical protein TNCV_5114331 [Trichonephila clavipes]|nr:hypothetical protein TNCV_5114331 [Trichonephila clavipes]